MPHYTQYMFNNFVVNPAVAGTYDYFQIRTNHRFQWVGLLDPPMTNSISFYGPHAKLPMGYGGYVYNDVTGPTSRTGVTGAYAYNIAVTGDIRLSMGLSASIMQYRVDGTQLNPADVSDPDVVERGGAACPYRSVCESAEYTLGGAGTEVTYESVA